MKIKNHDGQLGAITSAALSYDKKYILSTAQDGLLFVHQLDCGMIKTEARFDPMEGSNEQNPQIIKEVTDKKLSEFFEANPVSLLDVDPIIEGVDQTILKIDLKIKKDTPDITDETIYSIQQSKLRTEEDHRLKLAETKKEKVREDITKLREKFVTLVEKNKSAEDVIQVAESDFNIDPEFFDELIKRTKACIEETKKEEQWEVEKNQVKLRKIHNKFYD